MAKTREPVRLEVRKDGSLFIDGRFVHAIGERAEREDLKKAVAAARRASVEWSALAPSARGRALFRLAATLEDRRAQFAERLREIDVAVERTLWYAGWCDKYAAQLSSRNPVDAPFYCYSAPEPLGIAGIVAPDEPAILGLVSAAVPALVSGNTVVAIGSEVDVRTALTLCQCFAAADLPSGVFNLLTGRRIDLAPHLARNADIGVLECFGLDEPFALELTRLAADTGKRVRLIPNYPPADWLVPEAQDLARVAAFTQLKTIWHPARI